ncbi:MAG: hypothetical protein FWC95_07775 [Defluviitaleaceae bacterium]|nr:hypothetical protein [Defluviitaleaceae bacterium]
MNGNLSNGNGITARELGVFEILYESLKIYKGYFKLFFPLLLLAYIPINIVMLFFHSNAGEILAAVQNDTANLTAVMPEFRQMVVLFLVRQVFVCLLVAGFTYVVLAKYTGRDVTGHSVTDFSFSRWIRIAFTAILFYIIIGFSAFFIFPLIFFYVAFVFHANIAAVSGMRGFRALALSYTLVSGRFFKRLLYVVLFAVMQFGLIYTIAILLRGFYPAVYGAHTAATGFLTVTLNVIIDIFASFFVMVQSVWFVNVLSFMQKREWLAQQTLNKGANNQN